MKFKGSPIVIIVCVVLVVLAAVYLLSMKNSQNNNSNTSPTGGVQITKEQAIKIAEADDKNYTGPWQAVLYDGKWELSAQEISLNHISYTIDAFTGQILSKNLPDTGSSGTNGPVPN